LQARFLPGVPIFSGIEPINKICKMALRRMNLVFIPTLLIAIVLFAVGAKTAQRVNQRALLIFLVLGALAATPAVVFVAYYLKIFGEPIWLYEFRSLRFSELSAAGIGFVAGLIYEKLNASCNFRRYAGISVIPTVLILALIAPYLKPVFLRPRWDRFQDRWSDDICLQTSESSCGPACAATLLRLKNQRATERDIARASYTSKTGTENWYLARTLRNRGLDVRFLFLKQNEPWPFPAIAGVRLPNSGNSGHFITVLGRESDNYVVGDPLVGKVVRSRSDLEKEYSFTGFFMTVK
jgi:hypothetical protein